METAEQIDLKKHLKIRVVSADKRKVEDSYEHGQCLEGGTHEPACFDLRRLYGSLAEAIQDIFEIRGQEINPKDIATIDNTIYCDKKSGATKVVDRRDDRGVFRAYLNRLENNRGGIPTPETKAKWEKGEAKLFSVDYEIQFNLLLFGIDEQPLADLLGVNNFS